MKLSATPIQHVRQNQPGATADVDESGTARLTSSRTQLPNGLDLLFADRKSDSKERLAMRVGTFPKVCVQSHQ